MIMFPGRIFTPVPSSGLSAGAVALILALDFDTLTVFSACRTPERCPSGLRSTLGKRVCVAKRTAGSNPALSAILRPG